jgi:hypothetical protein
MARSSAVLTASLLLATASPALAAETFKVNPDAGNNTFSAIFDAALGERINAQSSALGCDLTYDAATGLASGTCSVPLTSVMVDNEPTKTDHFRQWSTNKKSAPEACRFEARFDKVRLGELVAEKPVPFTADVAFTICGRARADGGTERLRGTAVLFPPGAYGERKTIRVRASVQDFDRNAYRIGPQFTEGWLARVQSLAKVVAEKGTIEIAIFASPAEAEPGVARKP